MDAVLCFMFVVSLLLFACSLETDTKQSIWMQCVHLHAHLCGAQRDPEPKGTPRGDQARGGLNYVYMYIYIYIYIHIYIWLLLSLLVLLVAVVLLLLSYIIGGLARPLLTATQSSSVPSPNPNENNNDIVIININK